VKIVDAQVHIWSQTVVPTSGLHRKVSKFTVEELLSEMDDAGVDAASFIRPWVGIPTRTRLPSKPHETIRTASASWASFGSISRRTAS